VIFSEGSDCPLHRTDAALESMSKELEYTSGKLLQLEGENSRLNEAHDMIKNQSLELVRQKAEIEMRANNLALELAEMGESLAMAQSSIRSSEVVAVREQSHSEEASDAKL
jgi:hypothetical protein